VLIQILLTIGFLKFLNVQIGFLCCVLKLALAVFENKIFFPTIQGFAYLGKTITNTKTLKFEINTEM